MRSLKDVQDTMSNQNLQYTFPFNQFSFNTDIGFILLVEGKRSPFFTVESPYVFTHPSAELALIITVGYYAPASASKQGCNPAVQERL